MVTARIPGHVRVRTAVGGAEREGLLVVLVVEADQVEHREAVVGGEEVDGFLGPGVVVEVQPVTVQQIHEGPGVAVTLEVVPHRVAEPAVPLTPAGGEVADFVAPKVPSLRDDLDVLLVSEVGNLTQQRVGLVEATPTAPVLLVGCRRETSQHGGEVEPETVHAHHLVPVAERIHDQVAHRAVGEVGLVG